MVAIQGLVGLRPAPEHVASVTAPPYDVIKPGTELEQRLQGSPDSLFHVTLGRAPAPALKRLVDGGRLVEDPEPAVYVYEQRWSGQSRLGVFLAAAVSPYADKQIIRHEKTFDEKVRGRIALRKATGHSFGPVFFLTRASLSDLLTEASQRPPLYDFRSDFGGHTDLHGIENRVFRIPVADPLGSAILDRLAPHPLYIADGHHRYHASLLNQQSHLLCYVTEDAKILAYNRVVRGTRSLDEALAGLKLTPTDRFETPPKHSFALYSRKGSFLLPALEVPTDVVGRLDCAILERELYPRLGLRHEHIQDASHFDYYPETALADMQAVVDRGDYELAIALHPVSIDELMAVADAGLDDPEIVMPEKSTFFAPKILSGLFVYRHAHA